MAYRWYRSLPPRDSCPIHISICRNRAKSALPTSQKFFNLWKKKLFRHLHNKYLTVYLFQLFWIFKEKMIAPLFSLSLSLSLSLSKAELFTRAFDKNSNPGRLFPFSLPSPHRQTQHQSSNTIFTSFLALTLEKLTTQVFLLSIKKFVPMFTHCKQNVSVSLNI